MGFFGGGDFVDYTYLKKRGLLKMPEEEKMPAPMDKHGMLDFTAVSLPTESEQTSTPSHDLPAVQATPSAAPTLDFLDFSTGTGSAATPSLAPSDSALQLNEVKLKLDDTMFKLDLLLDKIKMIEQRLGLG